MSNASTSAVGFKETPSVFGRDSYLLAQALEKGILEASKIMKNSWKSFNCLQGTCFSL